MRPTDKPTGALWALLKKWSDDHPLHPTQTQMAGLFGVNDQRITAWKYAESRVQVDDMTVIAEKTGIPFAEVAEACAIDALNAAEVNARRSKKNPPKGTREQRPD